MSYSVSVMSDNTANIDSRELDKFDSLAKEWWDPHGKLKTLHHINPVRLRYIDNAAALAGKSVLDLGCGGGLLAEAMTEKGARVTGLDASNTSIEVARWHQRQTGKEIEYVVNTAEQFAQHKQTAFDVITCMELLEHVPDVESLISACSKMLKPGGHLILSTINRNLKAYITTVLGAEYLLGLLPKGTHEYKKFVRPSELDQWLRKAGLSILDIAGMCYIPVINVCTITDNPATNYIMHAQLDNR